MAGIMLVDDDRLTREYLSRTLEKCGYYVRQADNGRKAIESIVSEGVPELLIVDIFMPDMDGIETITHLKGIRIECPILAISGGGMSKNLSYLKYARCLGANKTLEKPISREDLLSTVSSMLS